MNLFKHFSEITINKAIKMGKKAVTSFVSPLGVEVAFNPFVKSLTAAYTVPQSESGMTYILNLAAGFATTLPAVKAGLKYKFIIGISNTGSHTIVAPSAIIMGVVSSSDLNAGTDSSSSGTGITTITLAANVSLKGEWVELVCDGTNWFMSAATANYAGITLS